MDDLAKLKEADMDELTARKSALIDRLFTGNMTDEELAQLNHVNGQIMALKARAALRTEGEGQ